MGERLVELLLHLGRIDDALIDFGLVEGEFDRLLDFLSQHGLHIFTHQLAVDTMAIADGKEMRSSVFS